jgi:hypothetical protein
MINIFNAYFDFSGNFKFEDFKREFLIYYNDEKNDKIVLIIDLENRNIGLSDLFNFIKIRKFFDRLGVEKLQKTIVCCKDGKKKDIIKSFLKKYPPEREVLFY